jgi:hypothetical protein
MVTINRRNFYLFLIVFKILRFLSFFVFVFFFSFLGVNCLQITDFLVPLAAKVGEDRQLSCQYQLGSNETLYFLRWYKDGNEFFRYMPKETPAQRVYNVSGVRIKVKTISIKKKKIRKVSFFKKVAKNIVKKKKFFSKFLFCLDTFIDFHQCGADKGGGIDEWPVPLRSFGRSAGIRDRRQRSALQCYR